MSSTRTAVSRKASPLKLVTALLVLAAVVSPAWADNDRHDNGHDRGKHGHDRRHDGGDHEDRNHDNRRGNNHRRGHDRTVYVPGWRRPAYRVPPRAYRHRYAEPRVHYRAPAQRWQRGARYYDRGYGPTYVVRDYSNYGLRNPPRGYYWRRDNRGEFLLVAIASGIIADLVLHGGR